MFTFQNKNMHVSFLLGFLKKKPQKKQVKFWQRKKKTIGQKKKDFKIQKKNFNLSIVCIH